jgi:TrmH family RNA methyltransferase
MPLYIDKITSIQNPKIKNLIKLQKASERREQGLFVIEGAREIGLALEAGYKAKSFFITDTLINNNEVKELLAKSNIQKEVYEITSDIFSKLAYREGSDGLLMLSEPKSNQLNDIKLSPNSFVIVLEAVEKPGNLGAILRTADAAGVDALIICDPRTDFYNPNVIRSSVGCLFTTQVSACSNAATLEWLKSNRINIYAAALTNQSKLYTTINFCNNSAVVMGTEADGLSDFWLSNCDEKIIIPMLGKIDSLNVSNATAIIVFEALRQRQFKKRNDK